MKLFNRTGFRLRIISYRLPHIFGAMLAKKMWEIVTRKRSIRSDLHILPSFLNTLLFLANIAENRLILNNLSMPFGGSLFIVAEKR